MGNETAGVLVGNACTAAINASLPIQRLDVQCSPPAPPFLLVVEFCLLALLLLGNAMVCLIVHRNHTLRNKANVFVAILAGVNLTFGFFTTSLNLSAFIVNWHLLPVWCTFGGAINTVFPSASNITLCFVGIDRLVFIRRPKRYRGICKLPCFIIGVTYIGVHALLFATLPPLWGWGRYTNNPVLRICVLDFSTSYTFGYIALLYGYVLPTSILLACYCSVYRAVRRQVLRVRSEGLTFSLRTLTVRHRVLRDTRQGFRRTARTLILMILLHIICWIPFLVVHFVGLQSSTSRSPDPVAVCVSWMFILADLSIQPWTYGMYNHTFRQHVWRAFTCCHLEKRTLCLQLFKNKPRKYQVSPFTE
ncbi:beta-1 adrenergic receptor-like [Acanthaster planci]|uniref:Beta-1 adrenergic receptor-like n=1 Tax=Acanthaster planci TaxID=133434 RepID=A0A8B7Z2J2_ACAPL|nr:beta-1 adrenergic receptor-like [Acanthaster planci]